MNHPAPVIRKGRKFDQVVEGARDVFLRDGYEGASVDEIARVAGVSKATLYSYFPDKRVLFMEFARQECMRQADTLESEIDIDRPVPEVLRVVGLGFLRIVLSDFGRNMFRVCVAESARFPDLGQQFYETGPKLMRERMIDFLELGIMRGELKIDDVGLAADQFPELCKAGVFHRLVFGIDDQFTEDEIIHTVDGAIATFMARYGV
ncbi:TetR/AcrR family transcriptional regulator [Shimia biformata]|uniref:TetR/AcrR family transcriptional regulator n=1 Tax=Shimia biformata TaxID=1294299 RepID=UPI00194DE6B0|nr:TetR/AcrR family transcriptional regulator [Shimia biformata]